MLSHRLIVNYQGPLKAHTLAKANALSRHVQRKWGKKFLDVPVYPDSLENSTDSSLDHSQTPSTKFHGNQFSIFLSNPADSRTNEPKLNLLGEANESL